MKIEGGVVSHRVADVEITCLPKDLPEFLELDLSGMHLNETKHLSDLPLPEGVTIPALAKGNATVVSIHAPRAEEPEPTAEVAAAAPAEGAAARPKVLLRPPAPSRAMPRLAPPAGDAKAAAAPAKKEGGKK